ncbi:hypothetical protein LCGC14_0495320 [marine sediment metagenome]|uniref:Zinc-ribbon domain-containing protein n=1 Tax=marine sediment metagenome TaxID=412755 RepID=A0A0F9S5F9_9ZZZZ|nr:hypothetical protein [bacterium]
MQIEDLNLADWIVGIIVFIVIFYCLDKSGQIMINFRRSWKQSKTMENKNKFGMFNPSEKMIEEAKRNQASIHQANRLQEMMVNDSNKIYLGDLEPGESIKVKLTFLNCGSCGEKTEKGDVFCSNCGGMVCKN